MIGTLPIDCDLIHGDLKLATITIDVPLKAGDIETREDGIRYIALSPDFTEGWFERALSEAVATLRDDNVTHATIRELSSAQEAT